MLIYDTEILKCIPDKNKPQNPELEYCGGWNDFKGMGISCLAYQFDTKGVVFDWDDFDERNKFIALIKNQSKIIGFNSIQFDDQLLRANGIEIETTLDVLQEIRFAAFGSHDWRDTPIGYTYSLDAIATANCHKKTSTGAKAPALWQQGQKKFVRDYCLNDVILTSAILHLALEGNLVDPNTGDFLKLYIDI